MKKLIVIIVSSLTLVSGTKLYAQDDIKEFQQAWGKDKKEVTIRP